MRLRIRVLASCRRKQLAIPSLYLRRLILIEQPSLTFPTRVLRSSPSSREQSTSTVSTNVQSGQILRSSLNRECQRISYLAHDEQSSKRESNVHRGKDLNEPLDDGHNSLWVLVVLRGSED